MGMHKSVCPVPRPRRVCVLCLFVRSLGNKVAELRAHSIEIGTADGTEQVDKHAARRTIIVIASSGWNACSSECVAARMHEHTKCARNKID